MYKSYDGGSVVEIQGLNCNIPPVGYVFDVITRRIEYVGVYERSKVPTEQYWEKPPLPIWYKETMKRWDDYDKKKKEDDPEFYDDKLEDYKKQEWGRRLNGFWFMNYNPKTKKSEAVYITGMYYMLLVWWVIDIGLADFTIPHLYKMYFLQYCIDDPVCFGMIDVTKRRFLKTFIGGLFVTERVSRTKSTNGGMQSKSGKDAKKLFSKGVVDPFRRLPRFFRPEYDMSLGVNPKTEMRFQRTNIRGRKSEDNIQKDELNSVIDWESADPIAYDGQKLFSYFCDEWGKTKEANVFERHEVIRYCLLDHEGRIIGKALYSTTVEKIDNETGDIDKAAKQLYDASDQTNRQENGQTESGLYRFFQTAAEAKNFDKYGYPDVEKNIKSIMADRDAAKNNPRQLSGRVRKEPLTIEDAFSIDAEGCVFNVANITQRKKELRESPIYQRKIEYYRDIKTQRVRWRDANVEKTDYYWINTSIPDESISNKFKYVDKNKSPVNIDKFAMAVDSYSNSQGGRKYGSRACAWVGKKYDINDSENTGKPTGVLYGRPNVKDDLHKQVLLCAEYHGCKVWYEHTADDYEGYFKDRGMIRYLGRYPLSTIQPKDRETSERHYGFPITPFSLTRQLDMGIGYVEDYCYKIDFIDIFQFLEKFDPYERTKFDMVVAFLMLIVVLWEPEKKAEPPKQPLIRTYA